MAYTLDTIFYHGSPYFFEVPNPKSYFATFPTLSLAILTEKANGAGYVHVYRPKTISGSTSERLVSGLFLTKTVDVDSLEAMGVDVPDEFLIAKTDNFYAEFIFDEPDKYLELFMVYKVDIEKLRQRASEINIDKVIDSDGEDILIREFMPTIDFINGNQ